MFSACLPVTMRILPLVVHPRHSCFPGAAPHVPNSSTSENAPSTLWWRLWDVGVRIYLATSTRMGCSLGSRYRASAFRVVWTLADMKSCSSRISAVEAPSTGSKRSSDQVSEATVVPFRSGENVQRQRTIPEGSPPTTKENISGRSALSTWERDGQLLPFR